MEPTDLEQLAAEIHSLDGFLLASVSSAPPDVMTPTEEIAVRAFIILACAAIEEFVEACFFDYVSSHLVVDERGRVDPGFYLTVLELREQLEGQIRQAKRTPASLLERVPGLYEDKFSKANNGIRTHNLQKLVQGAGMDWLTFEDHQSDLLAALDTLGSKRGSVAHVSSVVKRPGVSGIETTLYKQNVSEYVADVLKHLPSLLELLHSPSRVRLGAEARQRVRVGPIAKWLRSSWQARPWGASLR